MRNILSAVLFATFFIAFSSFVYAEDNIWCDPDKNTEIVISKNINEVIFDFTKTKEELEKMDLDTVSPYEDNISTEIGGVMKGTIVFKHSYDYGVRTNTRDSKVCMWFDKVTVEINVNPLIFIASEYESGSCKSNSIVEHEMKHVTKDIEISEFYAKKIRKDLVSLFDGKSYYGPVSEGNLFGLDLFMRDQISSVINDNKNHMLSYRKVLQTNIDNIREYKKVAKACL